jgi:ribosomal protein S19
MVREVITVWVRNLHCQPGLVVTVFGVYNNKINNMKDIIKQSLIGALYMFAACTFMATLVIALYTLAGY